MRKKVDVNLLRLSGRVIAAGLLLQLMWAANLTAEQRTLQLDPAKTEIHYSVGATAHTVHGLFQMRSGTIIFDPATGAASGAVIVDAGSGDSGTKSRDKKMDKDVLQVETYPEIAFYPKRVIGSVPATGASQIQVQGVLRLHGSDHDMTMLIPVRIAGSQVTASAEFVVPYVSWGMKDPSTLFLRVSKEVRISIDTAGTWK